VKLRISGPARQDLARIEGWLAAIDGDLSGEAQDAIADRIEELLQNPGIGSPLNGGARKVIERRFSYIIFYRVDADILTILRIRHAREDWR